MIHDTYLNHMTHCDYDVIATWWFFSYVSISSWWPFRWMSHNMQNSDYMSYFDYDMMIAQLKHNEFAMFFANSLWIHYLFLDFTRKQSFLSRIYNLRDFSLFTIFTIFQANSLSVSGVFSLINCLLRYFFFNNEFIFFT